MAGLDRWFPYRRESVGLRLFAFPHAGAGVTVFGALRQALERCGVDLAPAMLPGRERRLREAAHPTMGALLADFTAACAEEGFASFQGDYGLLGHCSGALVAYEAARMLERAPCNPPQLVVACSSLAPPFVRDTGMSRLATPELVRRTAAMGGTAPQVLDDPDFLDLVEPPLRADWSLLDTYRHVEEPRLGVPVLAVRGSDDPDVLGPDLRRWREVTDGAFVAHDVDAGHWLLDGEGPAALARVVPAAVSTLRDV